MERYTYFEDGKWRIRVGDTEHSGPWVDRLAAYEDTGLEPEKMEGALNEAHDLGYQACLNYKGSTWPEAAELQSYRALGTVEELSALVKARDEGRVVVDKKTALAMAAGARAIENNKRLWGVTYGWDIFGECGGPKEISYYEAAQRLREISEPELTRAEAELAQREEGQDA